MQQFLRIQYQYIVQMIYDTYTNIILQPFSDDHFSNFHLIYIIGLFLDNFCCKVFSIWDKVEAAVSYF